MKTVINIKTDKEVKKTAKKVAEELLGQVETDIKEKKNISKGFSSKKEIKKHFSSL